MNRIKTCMILGLTLFLAVSFSAASVFAASGNRPPGDPPYGLKVQGDAKGTKLIGVVYVELSDLSIEEPCVNGFTTLDATVRLRKGADIYTTTTGPLMDGCYTLATEDWTQQELMDALSEDVLGYFFPGEDLDLVLKNVSEWGQVQSTGKVHFLIDVVLAAQ